MSFLANILRRPCSHRFSWPRTDDKGGHYQICLACGAAYEYDWVKMKQTGRILAAMPKLSRSMISPLIRGN